jgi:hypothetical protein
VPCAELLAQHFPPTAADRRRPPPTAADRRRPPPTRPARADADAADRHASLISSAPLAAPEPRVFPFSDSLHKMADADVSLLAVSVKRFAWIPRRRGPR